MDGRRGPLESLLLELQAQLLVGQHRVQDALLELRGGHAAGGGGLGAVAGGAGAGRACAGAVSDDAAGAAVGTEARAAGVAASIGGLPRRPPAETSLQARTIGPTSTDEYEVLCASQELAAPTDGPADSHAAPTGSSGSAADPGLPVSSATLRGAELAVQSETSVLAPLPPPASVASHAAEAGTQSPSGQRRLLRAASRASSNATGASQLYSSASESSAGGQISFAPRQSAIGATGAMDMIGHDAVRSYDLRDLWRKSLPNEASETGSATKRRVFELLSLNTLPTQPSKLRRAARDLVQSTFYELIVILVIFLNSIFLGWQVQYQANHREQLPHNTEFEACFCVVFAAELCIKVYACGADFLFGADRGWNLFDVLVVVLMIADFAVHRAEANMHTSGLWSRVSGLRILRAVRVVRFSRAVRMLHMFSQLRIMIRSIMYSMRPLLWASLVLATMFYVFGICFTQGVNDYFQANDAWDDQSFAPLKDSFGTLERSVLSLFKTMSGGVDWGELFDTLSPLPAEFQCVLLFFVLFALFGAANVVTGIFVEIANHWSQYDSHTQVQAEQENKVFYIKSLRELFAELDESGDGKLTLEGMQDAVSDQRLVNSFHALQLELMDVRTLFLLLDRDRKGYIDTEEFLLGCFRLKGEAKTLDIMKLQYQSEWMMHNLVRICDALDATSVKVMDLSDNFRRVFPPSAKPAGPEPCPMVAGRKSLYRSMTVQNVQDQWHQVLRNKPWQPGVREEGFSTRFSNAWLA